MELGCTVMYNLTSGQNQYSWHLSTAIHLRCCSRYLPHGECCQSRGIILVLWWKSFNNTIQLQKWIHNSNSHQLLLLLQSLFIRLSKLSLVAGVSATLAATLQSPPCMIWMTISCCYFFNGPCRFHSYARGCPGGTLFNCAFIIYLYLSLIPFIHLFMPPLVFDHHVVVACKSPCSVASSHCHSPDQPL